MSFMIFAVFTAVGSETEKANAYLENTPIAVMYSHNLHLAVFLALG